MDERKQRLPRSWKVLSVAELLWFPYAYGNILIGPNKSARLKGEHRHIQNMKHIFPWWDRTLVW